MPKRRPKRAMRRPKRRAKMATMRPKRAKRRPKRAKRRHQEGQEEPLLLTLEMHCPKQPVKATFGKTGRRK